LKPSQAVGEHEKKAKRTKGTNLFKPEKGKKALKRKGLKTDGTEARLGFPFLKPRPGGGGMNRMPRAATLPWKKKEGERGKSGFDYKGRPVAGRRLLRNPNVSRVDSRPQSSEKR